MGFVYLLHLVDPSMQPEPATDTLELKTQALAMGFVKRMGAHRLSRPSVRLAALLAKAMDVAGDDCGCSGGVANEAIEWDPSARHRPGGPGSTYAMWTLVVVEESFQKLMPAVFHWARMAKVDVYDPQLNFYVAWRDPHGIERSMDPTLGAEVFADRPVKIQVWAAKIAPVPETERDVSALVSQLGGKQLKGRRFYQALGEVLWRKFSAAHPEVGHPLDVFSHDPRDWGSDLEAPCPAIWALEVKTRYYSEVFRLLCLLAGAKQLCLWVKAAGEWVAPEATATSPSAQPTGSPMPKQGTASTEAPLREPPAAPSQKPVSSGAGLEGLSLVLKDGETPEQKDQEERGRGSTSSNSLMHLRRVVTETPEGGVKVVIVREDQPNGDTVTVRESEAVAEISRMAVVDTRNKLAADLIAKGLSQHGFKRKGISGLEKHYPTGVLGLEVVSQAHPGGGFSLNVALTATLVATQKVLKTARLKDGDLFDGRPTLLTDLVAYDVLAHDKNQDSDRFSGDDDELMICGSLEQIPEKVRSKVLPILELMLADEPPWFMQPAHCMATLHNVYMRDEGWAAGMLPMNMEDLILARLCGVKDWDAYFNKRVKDAKEGRHAPQASVESLLRMGAFVRAKVKPDPELAKKFTQNNGGNDGALSKAAWAWVVVVLVPVLILLTGVAKDLIAPVVLGGLAYIAYQMYRLGSGSWLRFVLPLTVVFPIFSWAALGVIWGRRR